MTAALFAIGGKPPVVVTLRADTYSDSQSFPGTASASFSLDNAGAATGGPNSANGFLSYAWLSGALAAGYEVRATKTAGLLNSGTLGTWLSLAATRSWSNTQTGAGSKSATITFEIRDATSLIVVATASIAISADVA